MSHAFARKDANHNEIRNAFTICGWNAKDVSHHRGLGFDLIVTKGVALYFVEIKDGTKPPSARKLTEAEEQARNDFPTRFRVVTSVDDVAKLIKSGEA